MIKKIIYAGVFTVLLTLNGITVLGNETTGEQATGQTEFIYVADRPPDIEVDKGDGHLSTNTSPQTGDTIVQTSLELLVITSVILLMLIIYIKKGETYYEKDD